MKSTWQQYDIKQPDNNDHDNKTPSCFQDTSATDFNLLFTPHPHLSSFTAVFFFLLLNKFYPRWLIKLNAELTTHCIMSISCLFLSCATNHGFFEGWPLFADYPVPRDLTTQAALFGWSKVKLIEKGESLGCWPFACQWNLSSFPFFESLDRLNNKKKTGLWKKKKKKHREESTLPNSYS